MLYIGIDLGTSAVKLLLMDQEGAVKNVVSKEYPLEFPHPGWSQQAPEDWKNAVLEGIPELLRGFDPKEVRGIGAGGQMHGLVVLDEHDQVIRPAILWNDGRTAEEVDWLNNTVGKDKLSAWTANIAFAGFTAPKVLWLKKHEPEHFARIQKVMLPKDYINYVLTGVHCTDYSDASGMLLLDVAHKRWSQEMLDLCGLREAQMPRLFESYEAVGTLRPDVAARLGLSPDVVVCAGAGDNAAAAIGTGTVGDGACNISLGTSGTIFISSGRFGVDPNNALHAFAHADGHYHLMGCMLSAASCNKWLMEDIFRTRDYAAEQAPITPDKLGNNHVYFLPYLMGERSPHHDTDRPGHLCGPHHGHRPGRPDPGGAGGRVLRHPGQPGGGPLPGPGHPDQHAVRRRGQEPPCGGPCWPTSSIWSSPSPCPSRGPAWAGPCWPWWPAACSPPWRTPAASWSGWPRRSSPIGALRPVRGPVPAVPDHLPRPEGDLPPAAVNPGRRVRPAPL